MKASSGRHSFWSDDYSITEASYVSDSLVVSHGQVTDVYLAALALRNGGRLATFDARVAWQCVPGGTAALIEVIPSVD